MSVVYRIEHKKDGYGPWADTLVRNKRPEETIDTAFERKHSSRYYPGYYGDISFANDLPDNSFRVGVQTMELLLYWFGDNMDYILKHYNICKYTVKRKRLSKSKIQCVFMTKNVINKQIIDNQDIRIIMNRYKIDKIKEKIITKRFG